MFVHYYTLVEVPLGVVEQRLEGLRGDLVEWAGIAYRNGESLRAMVGPNVNGFAKEVSLEIGAPEVHRTGLIYPLKWVATGAGALFPTMSADLVLSHVGLTRTKITFEGTYKPPMGPLGRVIDRLAFGRFADATVKDWVDRFARALTAESVA